MSSLPSPPIELLGLAEDDANPGIGMAESPDMLVLEDGRLVLCGVTPDTDGLEDVEARDEGRDDGRGFISAIWPPNDSLEMLP